MRSINGSLISMASMLSEQIQHQVGKEKKINNGPINKAVEWEVVPKSAMQCLKTENVLVIIFLMFIKGRRSISATH